MYRLVLCVLVAYSGTAAASAQIVELSGGASTAYGSQGGTIRFAGYKTDALVGLGLIDGRLAAGGALVRNTREGIVTVGNQTLPADLPTDIFDTHPAIAGVGAGIQSQRPRSSTLMFVGSTSTQAGTPLFSASAAGDRTQFLRWRRRLSTTCNNQIVAWNGRQTMVADSAECKRGNAVYAFSAGIAGRSPYLAASFVLTTRRVEVKAAYIDTVDTFTRGVNPNQPLPEPVRGNVAGTYRLGRGWSVNGSHGSYATAIAPDANSTLPQATSQHSEMDTAGFSFHHLGLHANVNALHSTFSGQGESTASSTQALSGVVRYSRGRWEWSETVLASKGTNNTQHTLASTSVAISVSSHFRFTEAANVAGSQLTFSHGGSLVTRYSSFSADYEFLYVANRPDNPFQQALLLSTELPLFRGALLSASSNVSTTGKVYYTFQMRRSFAGRSSVRETHTPQLGRSFVRGRIVDSTGKGVGRAALMIGTTRLYTDSEGYFVFRENRTGLHPFQVLTDEFVSADTFRVARAPLQVKSSPSSTEMVNVVVDKVTDADPHSSIPTGPGVPDVRVLRGPGAGD